MFHIVLGILLILLGMTFIFEKSYQILERLYTNITGEKTKGVSPSNYRILIGVLGVLVGIASILTSMSR